MSEQAPASTGKITPQMGYGAIAGIVISEAEKFSDTLANQLKSETGNSLSNEFLIGFLTLADSFSAKCADRFASTLKQNSALPEVRETGEAVLARLIRNRCFDELDSILVGFLGALKNLNCNVSGSVGQLASSKVKDCASEASADTAAVNESGSPKMSLPQKLKNLATLLVWEYLRKLERLPHECLDYGAAKLFAGDVDFALQREFDLKMRDALGEKLGLSVAFIEALDAVKERKWTELRASEEANIRAAAMASASRSVKTKTGFSSLIIGGVCLVPIWLLSMGGSMNPYVIVVSIVCGIISILFFYRGMMSFTK